MFKQLGITRKDVFAAANTREVIKTAIVNNRDSLLGIDDVSYFFAILKAYTPSQMYGVLTPQYIAHKLGNLKAITSKDNLDGDFKIRNTDTTVEMKTTFLSIDNTYNLVQVRLYEDIDLFFVCAVDKSYNLSMFVLTKAQMQQEVSLLGSSAHVSSKYILANVNIEYRITLHTNNSHWLRWINTYRFETFDCVRNKFDNFTK